MCFGGCITRGHALAQQIPPSPWLGNSTDFSREHLPMRSVGRAKNDLPGTKRGECWTTVGYMD
jgi:hypothetical protein